MLISLLLAALPASLPPQIAPVPSESLHWRTDDAGNRAVAYTAVRDDPADDAAQQRSVAGVWSALGPFGGDIFDVAASPIAGTVVLAASAPSNGGGGLYRSTDGGTSWDEVASLAGTACYDIEFTPAGTAYVGTLGGLMESSDNG